MYRSGPVRSVCKDRSHRSLKLVLLFFSKILLSLRKPPKPSFPPRSKTLDPILCQKVIIFPTRPDRSSVRSGSQSQPHHKKKRHQRPRHKKEKEPPRKKKRHQKEQPQKATQAHKKKGMQPQLPLGQKTTDPNGRRSGRPKCTWWSKPLRRRSLNDSARYTWYSARRKAHSARCKYVARATLSVPVRTCTVAHFSDLSDSVFACGLGWMSNKECF